MGNDAREATLGRMRHDERLLAEGRCDLLDPAAASEYHGGHTFLAVSDQRLLWGSRGTQTDVLDWDAVESAEAVRVLHRGAVLLHHRPVDRTVWVPRHRLLGFAWSNARQRRPQTLTAFGFSRAWTQAAQVLLETLDERGIGLVRRVEDRPPRRTRVGGGRSTLYLRR